MCEALSQENTNKDKTGLYQHTLPPVRIFFSPVSLPTSHLSPLPPFLCFSLLLASFPWAVLASPLYLAMVLFILKQITFNHHIVPLFFFSDLWLNNCIIKHKWSFYKQPRKTSHSVILSGKAPCCPWHAQIEIQSWWSGCYDIDPTETERLRWEGVSFNPRVLATAGLPAPVYRSLPCWSFFVRQ